MSKKGLNLQILFVLGAIVLTTVAILFFAVTCSGGTISFEKTYYFVCYRKSDNAISAGSLSQTASNYGGAGYILQRNGDYFVTLSCYYKEAEAEEVCKNMKHRDLDCIVLKIETNDFKLQTRSSQNARKLYLGNLNTLDSLSSVAYDCANGLDTGEYTQSKAKQILSSVTDTLYGLLKANENNCFTESISALIDDCKNFGSGYLYSKNMRYIQIAVIDRIINAELK